ncbi:SDR family oxidoreductase [Leisingera sp. S132]|uniref:UDP-glucuronic acid decarboxylase family protein n=1 Tax=Leisingera sp. S132 TaxID=2867016 RepID=UPI0021A272F5|nr:UDP-glucuronic acid decarboxylase family protein [Leisingera sp. S132]UWQ78064.1 SDR family oxidoreductase [Leisingera sp. S132]
MAGKSGARSVLVAGGAGFLGAELCRRYLQKGFDVTCLDDLSSGRLVNLSGHLNHPGFTFLRQDVAKPLQLETSFEYIFNLACPASPPRYQADPLQTLKTCLFGAFNLLELARATGARILQASTSEVYGDPLVSPQKESYAGNVNTFGPRSCYDEGKRAAETIFHDYHDCYGVDLRVARIFNSYGPGMDPQDGRVVSNFITQALVGDSITVFGDGTQTRSFCYLDDTVDGLIALMHSPSTEFEPVNIGNPKETPVGKLAELVLQKIGSNSRLSYLDLPQDDPKQRRPDISRARKRLGWEPKVNLSDGLDRTIGYFRSELAASGKIAPGAM